MTDWIKIKNKILYLFTRNNDHTNFKKIFNIFKFILNRLKAKKIIDNSKLENAKIDYFKRKGDSWVILNYKRIIDPKDCPVAIGKFSYVTPQTFKMHCEALKQYANVISLNNLKSLLNSNQTPKAGTVIITFDGGHSDFLINASKSLLENNLSATICIPTAYINTKALLLDDMISTALLLFNRSKIKLKKPAAFSEGMFDSFNSTVINDLPSHKSAQTLFTLLLALPPSKRKEALNSIEEQLNEAEYGLNDWIDFLNWEDIQYLNQLGFDFTSMLNSHPIISEIDYEILTKEIIDSEQYFSMNNLAIPEIISLPYGIYKENSLINLKKLGYEFCLGSHLDEPLKDQNPEVTKILRRTLICEDNSSYKELFLSRIWDF